MTRAALLHVLDHPTAIAPAEVHELEQLAQAFPYCQTAHLLLAKAAHDQGTMLASQRLRRAATYATDRELLRRLIEQIAPAGPPATKPEPTASEATPAAALATARPPAAASAEATPEIAETATEAATVNSIDNLVVTASLGTWAPKALFTEAPAVPMLEVQAAEAPTLKEPVPEVAIAAEVPGAPALEVVLNDYSTGEGTLPDGTSTLVVRQAQLPANESIAATQAKTNAGPAAIVVSPPDAPASEPLPELLAGAPDEPELPAMAPPIHPPEAASAARTEFDLLETPAPAAPVYELPSLVDEWAAAASTLALAPPATVPMPAMASARTLTAADFTGDAELGYGLSGSSRLGFAVQLLNSWEADDRAANTAGPTAALPPTGEFFAPDALLLDYWTAHRPPEAPSSIDLINTFLRRQPRLTRPAMLPPATGAQADLSTRSTRPETELASEGLAQILARQGKTARAIEIYERLMVKQPEKMAYFASQIQRLQPLAR